MDHKPTVYATCFNAVLQAASALGADRHTLLRDIGVPANLLLDPTQRLPVSTFIALYEHAQKHTGNLDLALNVGRIIYFSGLNIQLYMTTICRNLREYLNVIPSTISMRGDLGRVNIRPEGDYIRLEWHPLDPSTSALRFLSDEMLCSAALIVGSICSRPVPVLKAEFSYPKPDKLEALSKSFCTDMTFGKAQSCLYFSRESLLYSLVSLDYELGVEFKAGPQSLFETGDASDRENPFLRDMKAAIRRALPTGELTIDSLSGDLGVSRRTLQRRLASKNSSFKLLLQNMREEMSLRYLLDSRLGITEIAFLLGYSDLASFSNAFRGWRNCSPSEYRNQQQI